MQDYAENDTYIYGNNIDDPECLFFIYDKLEQKLKSIYYNDGNLLKDKYPNSFLLNGNLLLHPERGLCRSMNNLNSLLFYDLQGNLQKEVVIGKERAYPEPNPQFLDFPDAKTNIPSRSQETKSGFTSFITVIRQKRSERAPRFCYLTGMEIFSNPYRLTAIYA